MNRFAHICIVMVGALLAAARPTPAHAATDDIVPTELTGNWFDPARDGEGCNLTLEGDGQSFILSCYTYLSGKQVWLIGAARLDSSVNELIVDNVTLTHGAQFGTAFRAEDVVRENWGRIVLSFDSCNTALIAFTPTDPRFDAFQTAYQKIAPGLCGQDRAISATADALLVGNWFNPVRDGEGIQLALEADGRTYVATYYTYRDGDQVWVIGVGHQQGNQLIFDDMVLTSGADFGSRFRPSDVSRTPWGRLVFDVHDCNTATVTIASTLPGFESLTVDMTRIVVGPCIGLRLQGSVNAGPVANALVSAQVSGRTYQTLSDAVGAYRLDIRADGPDDFVLLSAQGAPEQAVVRLQSLLGEAGRLAVEAGNDRILDASEDAQTDITHMTTAQAVLVTAANGDMAPESDVALTQRSQNFSLDALRESAAMIRLAVNDGFALPAGVSDTQTLVSSPEALLAFKSALPDGVLDAAVEGLAETLPASVAFMPGQVSSEYALYLPSPVGTVDSITGGADMFLRLEGIDGTSGVGEILHSRMAVDPVGPWLLQGSAVTVTPTVPIVRNVTFRTSACPSTTFVNETVATTGVSLKRLHRGAGLDIVIVTESQRTTYDFPPGGGCEFQRDFDSTLRYARLAFGGDPLHSEIPFLADEVSGQLVLPVGSDANDLGVARGSTVGVFDFDQGMVESPGMGTALSAQFDDGRIRTQIARADGTASYTCQYRRYRADGRKGDAVLALIERSDGARGIASGMSTRFDGSMEFGAQNAPGLYRSGLELSDLPGVDSGDFPFFFRFNDDVEHSATSESPEFADDGTVIDPGVSRRAWSVDEGRATLWRVNASGTPTSRDREWVPVARDGQRIYVLEKLFVLGPPIGKTPPMELLIGFRSNYYVIVDEIRRERPE